LRLFPNSHVCWGRNCLLRPFVEQPLQLPQKVLRQFPTVANDEFSLGFEGACDPSPTVANVSFF
jgi:hypothetical protein